MAAARHIDHDAPRLEFLEVLGLQLPITVEDVKQAYLDKARSAHPDTGGNVEDFRRLQEAFEQATEYAQFKAGRMAWLSQWVEQYAEQQKLEEEIKALGGTVEVKPSETTRTIGTDFGTVLERIVAIRLSGPQVDDQILLKMSAQRRNVAGLRRLELLDTHVTSVGLTEIQRLESLKHLDLSGTPVSVEDAQALLDALTDLESIVLNNCGISWAAKLKLRFGHRGLNIS